MILFTSDVDNDKLRLAFNNDIYEFYSTTGTPLYADITAPGLSIRIYPNPNNRFWINMKEYVKGLLKATFEDNLETNLQTANPNSFIYHFNAGIYLATSLNFTITFDDNTTDSATHSLKWIAGAEQIGNYHERNVNSFYLLSPYKKHTTNTYYLKYWEGYPFDFTLFYPRVLLALDPVPPYIKLENLTNGLSATFATVSPISSLNRNSSLFVKRLFLSDGRTDETIDEILPLVSGYNDIRIQEQGIATEDDKYLLLEKQPYSCGVYLKWVNHLGGFSYWLFEDTAIIDRSTKELETLNRDFYNLEDARTNEAITGVESRDTMRLTYDLANEDERDLLTTIFESPKVYLFTGEPFSQNSYKNWIEVTLKSRKARLKNAKQKLTNFSIDIELPKRYTQTL